MNDALQGVRVIDLTRVWAGPHATRVLADMGAEVIHVSSRKLVGPATVSAETARILGVYPDDEPGERHWNRNSQTNDLARNKYDVTLELDTPEGLALLRRLVALSDVVVENFSPRVMPKFGLDYPRLRELNPAIILCSMPGYGSQGPYRGFISYGTNLDPASGLASLMGYPGGNAPHERQRLPRSGCRPVRRWCHSDRPVPPARHRRGAIHRPLAGPRRRPPCWGRFLSARV